MSNTSNALLQELCGFRQWIVRRADKAPRRAADLELASVTNPADWCDYETAFKRVGSDDIAGVGFVLTDVDPYTCIDLDPTEDTAILSNHAEIFKSFNTYTELSPSGKGAHIWCKGTVPTRKYSAQHVEVYSKHRYMTVTGRVISNAHVADRQELLNQLIQSIDVATERSSSQLSMVDGPQTLTDEQVIHAAFTGKNGDVFSAIYSGNWKQVHNEAGLQRFPSASEADLTLCNILAFYSDNREQVGRIYWNSPLFFTSLKRKRKADPDYLFHPAWGIVSKAFDQKHPNASIQLSRPVFNNPAPHPFSDITFRRGSEIVPKDLEWLWEGYLPVGKLALLAGPKGVGKSTIAYSFAATVSTGGRWPDTAFAAKAAPVLIWTSEDDEDDTVAPRLIAMGANMDNIILPKETIEQGKKRSFDPSRDIPILKAKIDAMLLKPTLIIIDPIVSVVRGDMHHANDVRAALQPLVEMAMQTRIAVLGITHFAKNSNGRNATERILGSQAFGALARMNLIAAEDDNGNRVFCKASTNIAKSKGGFAYTISVVKNNDGSTGTAIAWGRYIDDTATKILAGIEDDDDTKDKRSEVMKAMEFLVRELKDGPRQPAHLKALAKEVSGLHEKSVQRAANKLNIQAIKDSKSTWLWQLPLSNPALPIDTKSIQRQADEWTKEVANSGL